MPAPSAHPPRVLWLGPVGEVPAELEREVVEDLAGALGALQERALDLAVISDPAVPLEATLPLLWEVDPDLVVLVTRPPPSDGLGAQASAELVRWAPDPTPAELRLHAEHARQRRALLARIAEAERALLLTRRWRESAEAQLRDLFHDLRTPVAVALGYCANVMDEVEGPVPEAPRRSLARARSALELAGGILASCRELHAPAELDRVLSQATDPRRGRRRKLRVEELAAEVIGLLERDARAAQVALELRVEGELPALWGDRARLAQLLMNLLGNGLRHARARVELRLGLGPEDPAKQLCLRVLDDGPGPRPELLSSLFERGVSGDGRTGLGLSIVREVAREHGGRCRLVPGPEGGAMAEVILPLDPRTRAVGPLERAAPPLAASPIESGGAE